MNETKGGCWRWCRAWPRRASVLAVTVGIVLLAACGGGSSAGSGGSTQATRSAQAGSAQSQQLAFAQCMRSHSLPNFPDPGPSGGFGASGNAEQSNPHYAAAFSACHHLLPYGGVPPAGANKVQQDLAQLLQLAQCMRAHGVSNYPDPNANPSSNSNTNRNNNSNLAQAGVDPNSPQFQAASRICERLHSLPSSSAPKGGGS
jgi:hypothetical protein